jgi:hypothetical protein
MPQQLPHIRTFDKLMHTMQEALCHTIILPAQTNA